RLGHGQHYRSTADILRRDRHADGLEALVVIGLFECGARLVDVVRRTVRPEKGIDRSFDVLLRHTNRTINAELVDSEAELGWLLWWQLAWCGALSRLRRTCLSNTRHPRSPTIARQRRCGIPR